MTGEDCVADLVLQWEAQREQGIDVPAEELCQDCPELVDTVRNRIADLKRMDWLHNPRRESGDGELASEGGEEGCGGVGMVPLQAGVEPIPGYRLVKRLGKGASGEVWSAESLGRQYAVKVIPDGQGLSTERRWVKLEKEGLARIKEVNHRCILHRHKLKSDGSGLVLLTELAETSLKDLFDELRRGTPKLSLYAQALLLLRDAAEGLDHLQAKGLMHLDIKPANLLLVRGRCKLGDFGTVKAIRPGQRIQGSVALSVPSADNPEASTTVHFRSIQDIQWGSVGFGGTLFTNTGAFTTRYAPPEAFEGKFSRSFDQYSLALTFCELVAGTIPFQGHKTDFVKERKSGKMELGYLPEELRPVLARALSPCPKNRFPTCLEFVAAMWDALQPLVKKDRKAKKWLDQWPVEEKESTHPLLSPAGMEEQPEAALAPGSLETSSTAEKSGGRQQKATIHRAGTLLGAVFSLFRFLDRLGARAGVWLRRRWKKVGPGIELFLRLPVLLALSLAVPVVLKVCVDRLRPLTPPPCRQGAAQEGNELTTSFGPAERKPREPRR
jgi:serine/threonine protein kinase